MNTAEIIAEYLAYKIITAPAGKEWQDGGVFALPFETRRHGTLWHFFTLGSVESFYAKYPVVDREAAIERSKALGHNLYWANANGASLTAWDRPQETVIGLSWGDVIRFAGKNFRLDKAPNDNVALVEV